MIPCFILILFQIVSSQNIQTINISSVWVSGNINCDDTGNFTECIINCNTDYSCGHDNTGPNIACLQNGSQCTINCNALHSCEQSTIYTHSTSNVNIEFFGYFAGKYSEIYAPTNGDLYVLASGGDQVFKYGKIYSQQTKSIDFKCEGLDDSLSTVQ